MARTMTETAQIVADNALASARENGSAMDCADIDASDMIEARSIAGRFGWYAPELDAMSDADLLAVAREAVRLLVGWRNDRRLLGL
jgi:hypothetical protein